MAKTLLNEELVLSWTHVIEGLRLALPLFLWENTDVDGCILYFLVNIPVGCLNLKFRWFFFKIIPGTFVVYMCLKSFTEVRSFYLFKWFGTDSSFEAIAQDGPMDGVWISAGSWCLSLWKLLQQFIGWNPSFPIVFIRFVISLYQFSWILLSISDPRS